MVHLDPESGTYAYIRSLEGAQAEPSSAVLALFNLSDRPRVIAVPVFSQSATCRRLIDTGLPAMLATVADGWQIELRAGSAAAFSIESATCVTFGE
jgi:hypothetical protein